jgi:hypothetical protein
MMVDDLFAVTNTTNGNGRFRQLSFRRGCTPRVANGWALESVGAAMGMAKLSVLGSA